MSIAIYNPYFYIIQHINSGKYYSGVQYGKNSNPDNLLKYNGYHTSSSYVKNLILDEGLESFVIRKIKVFNTGEEALDYESRFLRRVNAAFNDSFLNRCNNSMNALNVDREKRKQTFMKNFGVEYALQSEEIREKLKQTCLENFGVENPMQSKEVQEKSKQTCLEKYGVKNPSQLDEIKEKKKKTSLENFGFYYPSQSIDVQKKMKQTCIENFGVGNPMQSEEVREKSKQTFLEKYGVEHPSQSPEVQEKKRQKFNITNNRPVVIEIRKYRDKFKLKLGNRWFWKPQEFLDNMLAELKITYGLYY